MGGTLSLCMRAEHLILANRAGIRYLQAVTLLGKSNYLYGNLTSDSGE